MRISDVLTSWGVSPEAQAMVLAKLGDQEVDEPLELALDEDRWAAKILSGPESGRGYIFWFGDKEKVGHLTATDTTLNDHEAIDPEVGNG